MALKIHFSPTFKTPGELVGKYAICKAAPITTKVTVKVNIDGYRTTALMPCIVSEEACYIGKIVLITDKAIDKTQRNFYATYTLPLGSEIEQQITELFSGKIWNEVTFR